VKNSKQTSKKMSHLAGQILGNKNSSQISKQLAASLLAQTKSSKQTGQEMESIASSVLNSEKYSDATKAMAASLVSQSNKER
jgi:hypothetical protein